jgi:hypothetical protein
VKCDNGEDRDSAKTVDVRPVSDQVAIGRPGTLLHRVNTPDAQLSAGRYA